MTPQERKELEELLRTAEAAPKAAKPAAGRRAKAMPVSQSIAIETVDKDLSKEVARPKPPNEPLTGRWLKGFKERNEKERRLAPRGGGTAEAERVYRPADVGKIEEYRTQGHVKVAGRHVTADGLIGRLGQRRIPPPDTDIDGLEDKAEQVAIIAGQVLHGRHATVFEGRVLNPLLGLPKRSIADLAAQFGISSAKVRRIIEHAKRRVDVAFEQFHQPKIAGRCPTCGRVYADWKFEECARNRAIIQDRFIGPTWRLDWSRMRSPPSFLHPECLPHRYWADAAQMQKRWSL